MQKVLNDNYNPPDNSTSATRDLLSACKYNKDTKKLANKRGVVDRYSDQVKLWPIRKTCSYNQYMGHFKSIFKQAIAWGSNEPTVATERPKIIYFINTGKIRINIP